IGSKQYYKNSKPQSISELIDDVKNYKEQKIALYFCNQIKDYVLTVDPNLTNGYAKNTISIDNLIIFPSNNFLKGVNELSHILICLEVFYKDKIDSRKFSLENENWEEFNKKDKSLIMEAFKTEK